MAVKPGVRRTATKDKFSGSETDYLKLARAKATTAKEMPFYPKFLVYARKKKGKTTFALSAGTRDDTLLIDPEEGATYKKQFNPFIWPVGRWEDMDEVYGALRTGKLTPNHIMQGESSTPFKFATVDGLTRINNMALRFVMKRAEETNLDRQPGMVDRRDYNKSGELMKQMVTQFHTLRMGVIYTAQERMITASSGDEEEDDEEVEASYVPDLPQGVRGHVNSLVDVIGRLYTAKATIKGKESTVRRLYVGVNERYDTGVRTEYTLPDIIKAPTVPKIINLMLTGKTEGGS